MRLSNDTNSKGRQAMVSSAQREKERLRALSENLRFIHGYGRKSWQAFAEAAVRNGTRMVPRVEGEG